MVVGKIKRTNVATLAFMAIRPGETQEGISDIDQEIVEKHEGPKRVMVADPHPIPKRRLQYFQD
jgi:hypothetical protein